MSTNEAIKTRLYLLFSCLYYDTRTRKIFRSGERICINQERGALFEQLADNEGTLKKEPRTYTVPASIEFKIQEFSQRERKNDEEEAPTSYDWAQEL